MSKPTRSKKLPSEVEQLTDEEVMQTIFGKRVHERLKKAANPEPATTEEPDAPPTLTS
jgi:hypothetical protein